MISTTPASQNLWKLYLSPALWCKDWACGIWLCANRRLSERNGPIQIAILRLGKEEGLRRALNQVEDSLPPDTLVLCQCADITLTEILTWSRHPERMVGFDGLFFSNGPVTTLVTSPTQSPKIRLRVEDFVRSLGRLPIWVEDTPGLVLPRIVSMLANEATFALMDGVAEAEKIDLAMRLGVNYPRGPFSWAKAIGYAQVVGVLDHLRAEFAEERYRAANLLRRWARLDQIIT
jgi:3-hydroxybutyryl-CoA dehydrogenase